MKQICAITVFFLICGITSQSYAQRCSERICDKDKLEDYDYRSQTSFAYLIPGDTARLNIVVYNGQTYKIFTCSESDLGEVHYNIIRPIRKVKRKIKDINTEVQIEYKTDEYGEEVYDENWEPIEIGRTTVYDTIWETIRFTEDKVVFDNQNNEQGNNYWKYICKNTRRMVIEVIVPEGDPDMQGCVVIMVGRKTTQTSTRFLPTVGLE